MKSLSINETDKSVELSIGQDKFSLNIKWEYEKEGKLSETDSKELKDYRGFICQKLSDMLECDTL